MSLHTPAHKRPPKDDDSGTICTVEFESGKVTVPETPLQMELDFGPDETSEAPPMNCGYTKCGHLRCEHCFLGSTFQEKTLGDLIRRKLAFEPIAHDRAKTAAPVRSFDTGATRSADTGRYDPEGFLSPIVLERYSEYMNTHRLQPDGTTRDSDNWQKGMPLAVYMKGMWRHFLHLWTRHRGFKVMDKDATGNIEEDLCSVIFNAQGYLHEILKEKRK